MAFLNETFSIDTLPQSENEFSPLPAGWYQVHITGAELRPTKAGTGAYIAVRYDVLGPTRQGRVVFGNLNIRHPTPQAEESGRQDLGSLMRAIGLARGGSMENAVVIEGDRILNPEGLRRPDEFVRHKALDAIGDLYVLGAPIIGRYEGVKAGHAINNKLVRALLAQPDAWREVTRIEELAQAG